MSVAALYAPTKKWSPEAWVEPDDSDGLYFDRNEPAVRQSASWTCSAASLAWCMNSLGVDAPRGGKWDEWTGVGELRRLCGPGAVTPEYGLAYASGVDLETVYAEYGYVVRRGQVGWAELAYLCEIGIGQLGGARLYHWMGVRGYDGRQFNMANPALRWQGIGDELSAAEWNQWGAWVAVMVVGAQ